jgi:hypothetical protein
MFKKEKEFRRLPTGAFFFSNPIQSEKFPTQLSLLPDEAKMWFLLACVCSAILRKEYYMTHGAPKQV